MNAIMRSLLVPMLAVFGLSACASTRISDSDKLALYQRHAGAPVKQVRYYDPMGWDRVDDQHLVLQMRPRESWLLTLAGPCLGWGMSSPFVGVSSFNGMTLSTFDKILVPGVPGGCMIREIRPLDMKAIRAGEDALRARTRAPVQVSGT
ncbi:MAG: hypothetical protein KGL91_03225 [Xanthomonadaceae bacterium]|nr:hypothetical protein [Xanthomonadaceae bacterium]